MSFRFTVNQNPLQIEFEAGSIAEGIAILQDESTQLGAFFSTAAALASQAAHAEGVTTGADAPAAGRTGGRRGRPSNAEKEAARAAAASAPAPIAPPAPPLAQAPPAPPAPPLVGNDPGPIPLNLDRTGQTAAPPAPPAPVAAPSAPPPPPAPPAPVAPPAVSPLKEKVLADLRKRADGTADKGQALADWLASSNIVNAGATFEEALTVLQFARDEQVTPIATALGIN